VPRLECPWNKDGEIDWIPTRVKWVETISNNKKERKEEKEGKDEKNTAIKI
jgi:hypothetical protein